MCVGNLTIIGSDNGLSPCQRQAIILTNAGILLIGHLGTNFSKILITIFTFSFTKMHFKLSSAKFCLSLNVLNLSVFTVNTSSQITCFNDFIAQCCDIWFLSAFRGHLSQILDCVNGLVCIIKLVPSDKSQIKLGRYHGSFCVCAQPMRDDVPL